VTEPALQPRGQRRRRQTEARLLDAALEVFRSRGYDAATTGEMARAAGVAAGTFYLHFRDKRAVYEAIARRATLDLLAGWRAAMRPTQRIPDRIVLGLRLAADYWRADLGRARLLLEGGPSFGSEGHLRFVDEIAAALASVPRARRSVPTRALALLVAGLGIEVGRLIVARPDPDPEVDELMRVVRRFVARPETSSRVEGEPSVLRPVLARTSCRGRRSRRGKTGTADH
jgi:AcrR family transcriptional regulator